MTCEVCEKQPRGRRAAALPCMKPDPDRKTVSASMYGNGTTDEYFICTECGHKWMRESGNCGYGWQD